MYTVKSTYIKLRQELYRAKQSAAVGSSSGQEHKEFYKNSRMERKTSAGRGSNKVQHQMTATMLGKFGQIFNNGGGLFCTDAGN